MTNVFIDTNIFLNFFGYSTDHLGKLEEFVSLIKAAKIRLFLPQQVVEEFKRNRDVKLKEVLKNLSSFPDDFKSPVICHDLPEMKKIQQRLTEVSELRKKLIESIKLQIKSKSLKADKLVEEIFSIAKPIDISEAILNRAKFRYDVGNPPGKDASYGDAINWETLLESVPNSENLYLIARDKDYVSALDSSELSIFLNDEWKDKKKSEIFYYDLLSKFLKDKFTESKITEEEVKEEKKVAEQLPSGSASLSSMGRAFQMSSLSQDRFSMLNKYFEQQREIEKKMDVFNSNPGMLDKYFEMQREHEKKIEFLKNHPEIMKGFNDLNKNTG